MTTSNPAVGTRPGTFFVDRPDGFVWWVTSERAPSGVGFRWARFHGLRAHDWDYATQEEAEAADLVNVYAGAPAPLDPDNPEHLPEFDEKNSAHLRWLAGAIGDVTLPWASDEENHPEREQANDEMAEMVEQFADFWRAEADRLDRERAEAEQDAADRKLAHKVAAESKEDFTLLAESYQEEIQRHVLAGIRAERERQEAEK